MTMRTITNEFKVHIYQTWMNKNMLDLVRHNLKKNHSIFSQPKKSLDRHTTNPSHLGKKNSCDTQKPNQIIGATMKLQMKSIKRPRKKTPLQSTTCMSRKQAF